MTVSEANTFVTKLKAHGSENDFCNLETAFKEFGVLLTKLSTKDKQSFSLNVFCILCRNLDKVSSWRDKINNTDLTKLCIECVRQTRGLDGDERVKSLACVYHVHKYIVRQSTSVPPELLLKLSLMPFECDASHLLKGYHKTYWSILADRIIYIEKLKKKLPIKKLLPKLNEDLTKVITIYKDVYDFCTNLLPFVIKKLYLVFSDVPMDLNETFHCIFDTIALNSQAIKECNDKQLTELYIQFNNCIYIVTENSSKTDFKNSPLDDIVTTCLTLLGHRADIYHCLQTFYLNSFSYIFKKANDVDNVFKNLLVSCETTEKFGYKSLMYATYPFLNQLLRLWIEYYDNVSNIKDSCLTFMLFLMGKVKKCRQLVKCENCSVKSGLHDALRLSFLVKNLINKSIKDNSFSSKSRVFHAIINNQYQFVEQLKSAGCMNGAKYQLKLQTDVHNTAIMLHKAGSYDFSIMLFDLYLKIELVNLKTENYKNISRTLHNKSICELDSKMYENGIRDAFLGLVFAQNVSSEKYMNLIIDMKGKAAQKDDNQDLQLLSVLSACDSDVESVYGDMKPFFKNVAFSELLRHEFSMYEKLWCSLVPITGVIRSLHKMINTKNYLGKVEDKQLLKDTFYDILLKTPSLVRWIQNEQFKITVKEILENMDWRKLTVEDKMVYVTLLFLKSEQDIQDASDKYEWKPNEQLIDPDQIQSFRTLPHEFNATRESIRGVELLSTFVRDLGNVPPHRLSNLLRVCEVIVNQLLHVHMTVHALQLSAMCLRLATFAGDKVSYIRNVGVILYHADKQYAEIDGLAANAIKLWRDVMETRENTETALVFICEVAMYYTKRNNIIAAAKLVRTAQARIHDALRIYPDIQLELAIGRLMEVQVLLCPGTGLAALTAANAVQRHYLASATLGTTWTSRRRYNILLKYNISTSTETCVKLCKHLKLWRRAKTAGGAGLASSGAKTHGSIFADITQTCSLEDAEVKINNCLKIILGYERSVHKTNVELNKKVEILTPRPSRVEIVLDCRVRTERSPTSLCISVPAFKVPEFFQHASCDCYACVMPQCAILACQISSLEASSYFRSKQVKIARSYFDGALTIFSLTDMKLASIFNEFARKFEKYIVNVVKDRCWNELRGMKVELLVELAFFELSERNFEEADDSIVRIHEIMSEVKTDVYLRNEVSNLLVASALLREKPAEIPRELEIEFDALKISTSDVPKTPESKALPVDTVKLVKNEEIPKKLKVIKLNLDENPEEIEEKTEKPKAKFKIPEPVVSKPNLEVITPRPTRSRPIVMITQADTPKTEQFFTPTSTPSESFFTPQTSHKTYSRKIVKNLEAEFSTPIETSKDKKKDTRSLRKKTLLRATSPGKLENKPVTRTKRVKQPVFDDK